MRLTVEERFWKFVDKSDTCWEWTGAINMNGYGKFSKLGGGWESAHRVSYQLTKGSIPKELVVRHKCDNPTCVNPEHLELGTRKDNTQDMMSRKRNNYITRPLIGEKNPMSKLSDAQRKEIKLLLNTNKPRKEIAKIYNVSRQTIDNIAKIK